MKTDELSAAVRTDTETVARLLLDELAPEIREVVVRQSEENELLSAALVDMRARIVELEQLVDSDTLTPLPNRRCFLRELDRLVHHSRRYGTPAYVMFVDVDDLKMINDSFGHFTGDAALIHVAKILASMLRATDLVARIGGDEFGLLLQHIDEAVAREKAQKLAAAVAASPLESGGGAITLSVSIGFAEITAGDSPDAVLARADAAMYAVKAQPRSER